MALKRINKELTDLGRYVISFPSTARLACSLLLAWAATWQRPGARPYARTRRCCFARRPRVEYLADTLPLVTLPLPVRLALLEMIWYVTLCTRLPRLRHSHRHDRGKKRQGQTHANCAAVSLASNHHGSWRLTIFRRCLLPSDPFPNRLPLQAPKGQLHHPHLPPQHQLQRQHLFGYSARSMEPSPHHLKG